MVDSRQGKIFVTRDEGLTYVSYEVDFTPDTIKFQGRGVPDAKEGTNPEHMLGYDQQRQAVLNDCWGVYTSSVCIYTIALIYTSHTCHVFFLKNVVLYYLLCKYLSCPNFYLLSCLLYIAVCHHEFGGDLDTTGEQYQSLLLEIPGCRV